MPPRKLHYTTKFEKDVLRAARRGKNLDKLETVLKLLEDGTELPGKLKDHALTGDWKDCRDLHLEPDWLLIYMIEGNSVKLVRTGSHADLFR